MELLVVIGIIAVLISILLPALSAARRHANATKCMVNLRTLGQALAIYTQDTGYYPASLALNGYNNHAVAVWPTKLRRYLRGSRQPFRCPDRDDRFEWSSNPVNAVAPAPPDFSGYGYEVGEPMLDAVYTPFSYGYNLWGTEEAGLGSVREVKASLVRAPWDMIAITDSSGSDGLGVENFLLSPFVPSLASPGTIHFGGANVLFCDGHVQRYLRAEIILINDNVEDPNIGRIAMMWNRNHSR
jgi:prepilin-type processing-associated H-X9-DG protein